MHEGSGSGSGSGSGAGSDSGPLQSCSAASQAAPVVDGAWVTRISSSILVSLLSSNPANGSRLGRRAIKPNLPVPERCTKAPNLGISFGLVASESPTRTLSPGIDMRTSNHNNFVCCEIRYHIIG